MPGAVPVARPMSMVTGQSVPTIFLLFWRPGVIAAEADLSILLQMYLMTPHGVHSLMPVDSGHDLPDLGAAP